MWLVMDASRSIELSVLFFTLHIFRMTVFFVLAGFFARMLLERLGVGEFVRNRAKRIAMPLAMFWPIVLTAFIAVLIWAAVQANGGVAPEGPTAAAADGGDVPAGCTCGSSTCCCSFTRWRWLLRGFVHLIDRSGALRARFVDPIVRFVGGPAAPVLLAIPVAAALFFTPNWYDVVRHSDAGYRPRSEHDRARSSMVSRSASAGSSIANRKFCRAGASAGRSILAPRSARRRRLLDDRGGAAPVLAPPTRRA